MRSVIERLRTVFSQKAEIPYDRSVLSLLLADRTTNRNILWATDDYSDLGPGYAFQDQLMLQTLIHEGEPVIQPRVCKEREKRRSRSRGKAEVFTPSFLCNIQNNMADENWFGRTDIFNVTQETTWRATLEPIIFPDRPGKHWQDYVKENRLEICCGEAPYIVSRYDTTTGRSIALQERIGILDRKLRVVNEQTYQRGEWEYWACIAYQSTYGYEWQGDNLLLARMNLLETFFDYYEARFHESPSAEIAAQIATIISWNVWQMDGLKGVVPHSCKAETYQEQDLFSQGNEKVRPCTGCVNGGVANHTGVYCEVMDWEIGQKIRYIDLL